MYILKLFLEFIKEYKFTIFIYTIFIICSFPLESILVPQIYSNFFKNINMQTKMDVFIKYFIILALLLLLVNGSNCITSYIDSYLIPELNGFIVNYIFKNLLIKHENNISDIELGKIITRISNIPIYLREFISDICVWIVPRFFTILLINLYFLYLDWRLGLLSIILLIIAVYFNTLFFNKCSVISIEKYNLNEYKNQLTVDKLSNNYSIYSSGNLNKEILNYNDHTNLYTQKFKESLLCLNKINIFTSIIIIIIFIVLNSFSTYLFIKKKIDFTNLMAIFMTIIYYTPCIITINTTMPNLIHNYGILYAVDDFIKDLYQTDIKNKDRNIDDTIKKYINHGTITINNLNFGYNSNNLLFKNFYLTIKDKENIAIVGQSGNGKSSLIKLIMGYYKVDDNMIYIGDDDINTFDLNDLRKQISYVNQNNKLFNMTVMENIQYGNNMSEEEIIDMCEKLNISNIFKNLKDGYKTNVGIDGNSLSGGQRQIIHILRCIFKKNKIVILDEPTSAIDKDNTQIIINIIKELSKNSTLILITHDESILHIVDRIITLDSGKIVNDFYKTNS
jgi:ATP-binding cassette subfamily B protein